ncbi:MAG TPA: DUF5667 domain-containing protein [Nocardioidaceae bacterium]|nr:DUF5667 domain-containing protein [Nocardioidaceae bacterium]
MRSRLSRRDVEFFADAVDGRTPARRHSRTSDRLSEYVEVAEFVRETSVETASRDFVADLRAELMATAADELTSTEPVPRGDRVAVEGPRLRRRLAAAAGAFVVVGGSLGLVSASAQAVPGDMLYPVKRATERVELMLRDGSDEGRMLLNHASTRLDEVESLAASNGREDLIAETLSDFTSEADAGGTLLLDSYRNGGSTGEVEGLRIFLADSAQRLEQLADDLPSAVANEYADAAQTIGGLDSAAVSECPTCADGSPPLSVDDELMAAVSYVLDPNGETTDDTTASDDPSSTHHRPPLLAVPPNVLDLPNGLVDNDQEANDSDDGDDLGDVLGDDSSDGDTAGDDSDSTDTDGQDPVDDVTDGLDETTDDLTPGDSNGLNSLIEPIQEPLSELLGNTLGITQP